MAYFGQQFRWRSKCFDCPYLFSDSDPCSSYKELSEADRERKYTQDTSKSDVNDLQAGSWYRFTGKAGYKLSNRYVPYKYLCPVALLYHLRPIIIPQLLAVGGTESLGKNGAKQRTVIKLISVFQLIRHEWELEIELRERLTNKLPTWSKTHSSRSRCSNYYNPASPLTVPQVPGGPISIVL